MRRAAGGAVLAVLCACGSAARNPPPPAPEPAPSVTTVELSTFEVRHDELDRFEHCPPPGEIGQAWFPSLAGAIAPAPALADEAVKATHDSFRHCFHQGLLADPTQDGRVAVVLHVADDGHVARVETWGACDLATPAIACMREEAARLQLRSHLGDAATVTVPAVFTRAGARPASRDAPYAAAAYLAVEMTRPHLHQCERAARIAGDSVFASATMTIDVDAGGHGTHVAVDPWHGEKDLLACAAQALQAAPFPPPPGGRARVIAPIAFNARAR